MKSYKEFPGIFQIDGKSVIYYINEDDVRKYYVPRKINLKLEKYAIKPVPNNSRVCCYIRVGRFNQVIDDYIEFDLSTYLRNKYLSHAIVFYEPLNIVY